MSQSGCYDMDGKCTVCGQFAPCNCEIATQDLMSEPEWAAQNDDHSFEGDEQ
jgi:hypothetical protein